METVTLPAWQWYLVEAYLHLCHTPGVVWLNVAVWLRLAWRWWMELRALGEEPE